MQKEALVFNASSSYFFEWKNVMLSSVAVERSLISEILDFRKFSLFLIPDNFKSLSILYGPLFLKKRINVH